MNKQRMAAVVGALSVVSTWLSACAADSSEQLAQDADSGLAMSPPNDQDEQDAMQQAQDALLMPPLQQGFQRFVAEPIEVAAGVSADWAQWVGGPLDQDYDVVSITGAQSRGGHHALMYATNEAQPVGHTRLWEDADQLTTRLMGGVGGEGGANATLPPGVVFRVKKGSYLMIQTHYLNATEDMLMGRTVLDVKLAPVDASHRVASIMASTDVAVSIAPGVETTMDFNCEVQKDLHFIQISNHMHELGKSTFTEYIDVSGAHHELKTDAMWSSEWALNPNFKAFPVEAPLVVPAGSTLHTQCVWQNTTAETLTFPTEMCVFFGFILNESDIYCRAGSWSETGASASDDLDGVGGDSSDGPAAEAACANDADHALMDAAAFEQQSTVCATGCGLDPDVAGCTATCFRTSVGLSDECATCNGDNIACGAQSCLVECVVDNASPQCRTCVLEHCDAAYQLCNGD